MLTLHYILNSFKMYLILFHVFDIKKMKPFCQLHVIIAAFLITADFLRYRHFGYHPVLVTDFIIELVLVVISTAFLIKDFKVILMLTNIYLFVVLWATIGSGIVFTIFTVDLSARMWDIRYSIAGTLIGLLLLLILLFIYTKSALGIKLNLFAINLKLSFLLLTLIGSFGFYASNFIMYGNVRSATTYGQVINVIAMIAGILPIFLGVGYVISKYQLQIKNIQENSREELALYEVKYKELEHKKSEETRRLRHDMNEHLLAISELTKRQIPADVNEYLATLIEDLNVINNISGVSTGSYVVNVNLNYLKTKYADLQIKFKWDGRIPKGIQITDKELTELFANLLKNAFEAVAKVGSNRYISVSIREDDSFLYISVKNSYIGGLKFKRNLLDTHKFNESNHGFGLQTIRNIVKKYDGDLSFHVGEAEFEVEIIFSADIYGRA